MFSIIFGINTFLFITFSFIWTKDSWYNLFIKVIMFFVGIANLILFLQQLGIVVKP